MQKIDAQKTLELAREAWEIAQRGIVYKYVVLPTPAYNGETPKIQLTNNADDEAFLAFEVTNELECSLDFAKRDFFIDDFKNKFGIDYDFNELSDEHYNWIDAWTYGQEQGILDTWWAGRNLNLEAGSCEYDVLERIEKWEAK